MEAVDIITSKKNKVGLCVIAIIVVISLLVFIAPMADLPFSVPTWPEVFSAAGLRDNSDISNLPLSVHFIDVGQGDCILIKTKDGNALVDAGNRGQDEAIIRYLWNQNVEALDIIFITHTDSDHIGGMPEVIEAFDVSKIIMPELNAENIPTTKIFEKLMNAIYERKIPVQTASQGQMFEFGEIAISVLGPISISSKMNNMSIVLRIEHRANSFMLTGDAEFDEENEIVNSGKVIKSDVLKVGHHGGKTSSGAVFLRAVSPRIAVISCGENNSYGHPSLETLERLDRVDANVYRTDWDGTVIIGSDGAELSVSTEKE
jgi:competence protein ComEC